MKPSLLIVFLIALSHFGKAQLIIKLYEDTHYIDSLEKSYATAPNDSTKALLAFKLSYTYKRAKKADKAQQYFQHGVQLTGNNSFLKAAAPYYEAYLQLGKLDAVKNQELFIKSDSLLASFYSPEAYRIRSNAWMGIGVMEQIQGHEKNALEAYINHALVLAKKSENKFVIGASSKFVGISLYNAQEYEKAYSYLKSALEHFQKSTGESEALKQEAAVEVLVLLTETAMQLEKMEDAKNYLDQSRSILSNYPESNAFLFYYYPEGIYYQKIGQINRAIESFNKGIALQSGTIENLYINRMKYAKFELLRKLGRNKEAINVMQDLLKSQIILTGDRMSYYNLFAQTYAAGGNMNQAYYWAQKYIALSDSMQTSKYKAGVLELEKKFQTNEKETQILQLKAEKKEAALTQQNQRLLNWLFGTGAFIFLLALFLLGNIYRNSKKNNALRLKEMEQQKTLQVTQAVLEGEERERQRIARDLHDGLGGTLSGIKIKLSGQQKKLHEPILDETIMHLDNSISDLRRIARNMMPETLLRSGLELSLKDLCASLSSPEMEVELQTNSFQENLPLPTQVNIYRIVQELLSNAYRHSGANKIIVQCLREKEQFLITVEDNGIGFDPSNTSPTKSMGLANIQNRVQLLNGHMQIDSTPEEGTIINIELNV